MNILFKEPEPGDLGWLISAHGRIYAQQYGFDRDFEMDIARKVLSFLEREDAFARVVMARKGREPIGSIAVSRRQDGTAFINFLLVVGECRGRGIAGRLLEQVVSHARAHGIGTIGLETYSILTAARRLYGRFGFTLCESRKGVNKYGRVFDQEFWSLSL